MTLSLQWTRRSCVNLLLTVVGLFTPLPVLPHPKRIVCFLLILRPLPLHPWWVVSGSLVLQKVWRHILGLPTFGITRRVWILFSVSILSCSVFLSDRLVHTQWRTLIIWETSWPNIATSIYYIYFVTSFSFNMSAPKLTILIVYCMKFALPFRVNNLCLRLTERLFSLQTTPCTNVLLNFHHFSSLIQRLGILVLSPYYVMHWALNCMKQSDLTDITYRITQLLPTSLIKRLLCRSWE